MQPRRRALSIDGVEAPADPSKPGKRPSCRGRVGSGGAGTGLANLCGDPELVRLVPYNETVCDPVTGSGSIGQAAIQAAKFFIGMEVYTHYYQIGVRRLFGSRGEIAHANQGTHPSLVMTIFQTLNSII